MRRSSAKTATTTSAALVAACSLAGCWAMSMIVPPSSKPESVPVPIAEGGSLPPILLSLAMCTKMGPEIGFPKSELQSADLVELVGATPGFAQDRKRGVPLRLIVDFYREMGEGQFVLWRRTDSTTEFAESFSNNEVARMFRGATLPSGKYRVKATLAAGSPALAGLNARFYLWSTFKSEPSSKDCSEPAYRAAGA